MDEDRKIEQQTSVETAFDELIVEWARESYSEEVVIETMLKKAIGLTFRMTTAHQDALDMIAEQVTDAMIEHPDERTNH